MATNARSYAPLSGIQPGEVALLEIATLPGSPVKMSTGVMVIYADREAFTFMTPEGHALSAWITFSAFRDGDVTVAQAQALERTADPFVELAYILGAQPRERPVLGADAGEPGRFGGRRRTRRDRTEGMR